jgi:hypothetical protein
MFDEILELQKELRVKRARRNALAFGACAVVIIVLGTCLAFAQQPVELPEVTMTPNERVQQAFKALEEQQTATFKAFSGPFMQAYGDTSQFVCTAVGPDGWCMNPFGAMAKE